MKKVILILFLANVSALISFAQCGMIESPLSTRVSNSTLIVEGKVTSSHSVWNMQKNNIFTIHTIEVTKVFQGNVSSSTIDLVTEGGTIGNTRQKIYPTLTLNKGDVGIWLCYQNDIQGISNESGGMLYRTYSDLQGFIRYDKQTQTASDLFHSYENISSLYAQIVSYTGIPFTVKSSALLIPASSPPPPSSALVPTITSFSPNPITAGTVDVLTINGSGFGSSMGGSTVKFKNADDGGASMVTLPAASILTWSDTQITLTLETGTINPGTGTFTVTVGASTATSPSALTISYSEMNVLSSGVVYQTDHISTNGAGGYTWRKNAPFAANTNAVNAFNRAMETWRCKTHIQWVIGPNIALNNAALDGTNVITFDTTGAQLPASVLGRCSSWWSGCGSTVVDTWYVNELDIVFDDAANWYYLTGTPGGSQSDFESVALHELGHGHQFEHVIDNNDVMHYALTTGTTRRFASANNIACGLDLMSRSTVVNACPSGVAAMTPFTNCTCSFTTPTFVNAGSNSTICNGDIVTLGSSSITGHTYSWSPVTGLSSSTISNPTANPSSTTTYTLTETDTASNCVNTDLVSITIGSSFSAIAGSDQSICGTGSATLGGPPFPGHTYSWSPVTGLTSPTNSSTLATPTSTTTYTVTETQTSNGCQATDVVTVTVGPSVTANAGADVTFCGGSGVVIGELSTVGYTYSWSPSTGLSSSTISNPLASPASATTYTVTKTHTASGCFDTDVITVSSASAGFAANAGSDGTICSGLTTSVQIGASSISGHTYSWIPVIGLSSSSSSNPNASPSVTTIYTLTEIHTASGCAATDTVTVFVGQTASASFIGAPLNGPAPLTVNFTDQSVNASNWMWDVDNSGTTDYTTQNPTHTYNSIGWYTVVLKVNYGCFSKTNTHYVNVYDPASSINELENAEINVVVYPNPFTEKAFIQIPDADKIPSDIIRFELFNVLGMRIKNITLSRAEAMTGFELSKSELAEAMYFFTVRTDEVLYHSGKLVAY